MKRIATRLEIWRLKRELRKDPTATDLYFLKSSKQRAAWHRAHLHDPGPIPTEVKPIYHTSPNGQVWGEHVRPSDEWMI